LVPVERRAANSRSIISWSLGQTFPNEAREAPVAFRRLWLKEDGTTHTDGIDASPGDLSDVTLFDAAIHADFYLRVDTAQFSDLLQNLGDEGAPVKPGVHS
jgi:hypothetical protein